MPVPHRLGFSVGIAGGGYGGGGPGGGGGHGRRGLGFCVMLKQGRETGTKGMPTKEGHENISKLW